LDASGSHAAVAIGPLVIGVLLLVGALALLWDDASHRGLSIHHWLQPILALGAAASAVYAHHRFASWSILGGLSFASVAALGSLLVVYGTMGRQADARDAKVSVALAANRTLQESKDALEVAKADAARECKTGVGKRCETASARVDKLIGDMAKLRTVNPDPRADAIGDLAKLLGFDKTRTVAIVTAIDPIALPTWLELGSIVFLATAFPARKRSRKWRKRWPLSTVSMESEESVETLDPVSFGRDEALDDFRNMRSVPSQKVLANRWGVGEGTVSKWLASWESEGLVGRGPRIGRERAVLALPSR
jgi:hypothetical protein